MQKRGPRPAVEKTLRGKVQKQTFPPSLEIPQKARDSHFPTAPTAAAVLHNDHVRKPKPGESLIIPGLKMGGRSIYRQRWQIELFFKALKQNLRIKTFVGTSANALQIQVWTALIALLLLKYLQLRARFGWSLSNLAALLRQQLFVY